MPNHRSNAATVRGFSLLELLVVVAIISILSAIGVYNLEGAQGRAKTARAMADMRTLGIGIESYAVDHNEYPPNLSLSASGASPADAPTHLPVTPPQITTPVGYLTSLPADPFRVGRNVYGLETVDPLLVERLFYNYFRVINVEDWMRDYIGGRYSSLVAVNIPPEATGLPGNIGAEIKHGKWFLWSCGPDLRNWEAATDFLIPGDLGSPLNAPVSPPYGYTFDVPYDPTNGSTSFGNIVVSQAGINWERTVKRTQGGTAGPTSPGRSDGGSDADGGGGKNGKSGAGKSGNPGSGALGEAGGTVDTSAEVTSKGGGRRPDGGSSESSASKTTPTPEPKGFKPTEGDAEPTPDERVIAMGELMHSRVAATRQRPPRVPKPPSRLDGRFASLGLLMLAIILLMAYIAFRLFKKGSQVVDPDDINDESIAAFNLAGMTELHLANNHITDEGLEHLGQAHELLSLNLWGAQISDKGLAVVAGLPKLRELVLCDTPITDAGVKHLAKLPALRELVLMGTDVTDASVPVLSKMSGLELLNLRGTQISPAGLLRLREALPYCDIKYAALSEEVPAED